MPTSRSKDYQGRLEVIQGRLEVIYSKIYSLRQGERTTIQAHVELPIPLNVSDSRNSQCTQMSYAGDIEVKRRKNPGQGTPTQQYVFKQKSRKSDFHALVNVRPWARATKFIHAELADCIGGDEIRIYPLKI